MGTHMCSNTAGGGLGGWGGGLGTRGGIIEYPYKNPRTQVPKQIKNWMLHNPKQIVFSWFQLTPIIDGDTSIYVFDNF